MSNAARIMEAELRHERLIVLSLSVEAVDEAIADHYSRIAATAMSMRKLTHHRQMYAGYRSLQSAEMDKCITLLREQIERDFEHAFGIVPQWASLREAIAATKAQAAMVKAGYSLCP